MRAIDRFAIARGQAYFELAFSGGDLLDGFLFSHIWGKTLRDRDVNVFV